MQEFDLIIVGAGPAGVNLASELRNKNYKILILDRKKNIEDVQYNTSGSFIDPEEWNLPSNIFTKIDKLYVASKNQKLEIKGNARIINRKKLLSVLEKRALENKNLIIRYSSIIGEVETKENRIKSVSYVYKNKKSIAKAKIYVDCSGYGSVFAKALNFEPIKQEEALGSEYLVDLKSEPNTADLFVGRNFIGGYGWVFPTQNNKAIIGFGTLYKEKFKDVGSLLDKMWENDRIKKRGKFQREHKCSAIIKTGPPLKNFTKGNLVLIGDSGFQANPIAGEGIRFVMDSSRIASKYIAKSLKKKDLKYLSGYSREWVKKYYKSYKLCFMLQEKIKKYSLSDRKTDFGVKILKVLPEKDVIRIVAGDVNYSLFAKIPYYVVKYKLGIKNK